MNIFRFFTILFLKVAKRPARAAATLSEMGIKITLKELVSLFTSGHTSMLSLDLSSMALSTSTATRINLVGIGVVIVLLYK